MFTSLLTIMPARLATWSLTRALLQQGQCTSAPQSLSFAFMKSAVIAIVLAAPVLGETVINVPPDFAPSVIGADTILYLLPGGVLSTRGTAIASDGAIINVLGGRVRQLVLKTSAVANVDGGGVHERFWVQEHGKLLHNTGRTETVVLLSTGLAEIRGGAIEKFDANQSSSLLIHGINFAINGVPVNGLNQIHDTVSINLPERAVLTALLADGTAFGHYQQNGIEDGVLTLQLSADPALPVAGTLVVDSISNLFTAGAGQTVQVVENGRLQEQFRAGPGSRVEVNGGRIDAALHAIGAQVVLNEGTIGRRLQAFNGATIDIHGGLFSGDAQIHRDATLNINGGETGRVSIREGGTINVAGGLLFSSEGHVDSTFNMTGGKTSRVSTDSGRINLRGGSIIDSIDVGSTGVVDIAGGRHTDNFKARAGRVVVRGSEFRVNGIPISNTLSFGDSTSVDLSEKTTFSGVYADGTPFVFHGKQEEISASIEVIKAPTASAGPAFIRVPNDPVPAGLRDRQTLLLSAGGELPDYFTAGNGSTLLVQGGKVGDDLEVVGATVNATGGEFRNIDAFTGSVINLGGDAVWAGLDLFSGAVATISGGRYTGGNFIRAHDDSTLYIAGGKLEGNIEIYESIVHITEGQVEKLTMYPSSTGVVSGGKIDNGIQLFDGTHLLATGGTIGGISTSGSSAMATTATVDGADVTGIWSAPFSEITVLSGIAGDTTVTLQGGSLQFFGGALDDTHQWLAGSVEINGYAFQVDGSPITSLRNSGDTIQLQYTPGTTLTGIMADGTPFNLAPNDSSNSIHIADGVLTLIQSTTPALPASILVSDQQAPYGVSNGQDLTVQEGGVLRDHFIVGQGSTAKIEGGEVGRNFEADRSSVMITGGVVGDYADAFAGSTFTIAGGSVGDHFEAHRGSTLLILGGQLGRLSKALPGSHVRIQGGSIGSSFRARSARVEIAGGETANEFEAAESSLVIIDDGIIGSNFHAKDDAQIEINGGQIGSGFDVRDNAQVNVTGGIFQGGFAARGEGVVINISGGDLVRGLLAVEGAEINILGGQIGDSFTVQQAEVAITDGEIGDRFKMRRLAKVMMSGGKVGDRMEVESEAEIHISGGTFGDLFRAFDGSKVTLEGFGFALDGTPVAGLSEIGSTLLLGEREGSLLTGFFNDGTPFQFQLNDVLVNPPLGLSTDSDLSKPLTVESVLDDTNSRNPAFDYFGGGASLQIVLSVPEPTTGMLLIGFTALGLLARRRPNIA